VSPTPPLFLPAPLNERLWHIPFNALEDVNEKLVSGREEIFLGAKFSAAAGKKMLSTDAVKYYVDLLAGDPDAMLAALIGFLAPYRDGWLAAHNPR
jgi:hypothetical protein